jgi:hypothetical protein
MVQLTEISKLLEMQPESAKEVSRIKQKLKNNWKFFVVNLMCGTLSLYAHFFRILW